MFFVLGAALAGTPRGALDLRALSIGMVVMLLVHVITHYVNDAEDVATDERSQPSPLTGGSRAIQRGLVTPAQLLGVSAVLAVVVVLIAAAEIATGDHLAGALYLAILFFGYAYSGRPFMLGRRGMSEVDAGLVMGVLVPLAGAHVAGGINRAVWAAAGVLFVDTMLARMGTAFPDLEADRETGKRTIPAMVGPRRSVIAFALLGLVVAAVGFALAPLLPEPDWQRARAVVGAAGGLLAAWAIASGAAARWRMLVPLVVMGPFGLSAAVLFTAALAR